VECGAYSSGVSGKQKKITLCALCGELLQISLIMFSPDLLAFPPSPPYDFRSPISDLWYLISSINSASTISTLPSIVSIAKRPFFFLEGIYPSGSK
jgi:hypothetical protein